MRRVIIPVGPLGTGKSTFCQRVIAERPDIVLIERDAFLMGYCGRVFIGRNSKLQAEAKLAYSVMWHAVMEALKRPDVIVILDCPTLDQAERYFLKTKLEKLGADTVEVWMFITTEDQCAEWYSKRWVERAGKFARCADRIFGLGEREGRKFYRQLHRVLATDDFQWADAIHYIDPVTTTVAESLEPSLLMLADLSPEAGESN